ncbi:F-box domain-containing protein [Mycena sanguinolenta]|uniref:F-box domain-containing protein n=1 Tax=Mycena sanguinolenta TaxID=230812 RepID=A0A8H6YZ34_9AGAR|nr:F-box domain-containing protein [Mycena sanguinolenta]
MPFTDLDEDIILTILRFCDVYRVLTVSAINKAFRRITLTKSLWLSLVQDDAFRSALELPPPNREELEKHSTGELIHLVKTAVNGQFSSRTTDYKIYLGDMQMHRDAHLFEGARYILLRRRDPEELHIYDVWHARRVWTRPTRAQTSFQFYLVPGTAIARVLLGQPGLPIGGPVMRVLDQLSGLQSGGHTVQIEEVDLTTGISHNVFDLGFVTTSFLSSPSLVGDVFLWIIPPSHLVPARLLLVNWRTSAYVVLSEKRVTLSVKLIPGHVVWTYRESIIPGNLVLTVTALETFSAYWRPMTELNLAKEASSSSSRWPATAVTVGERLEHHGWPFGDPPTSVQLSVAPSALCLGAYNIAVQARKPLIIQREHDQEARHAELSYRFTPGTFPEENCKLQLMKQRALNATEVSSPRAVSSWSDRAIIVSYRQ